MIFTNIWKADSALSFGKELMTISTGLEPFFIRSFTTNWLQRKIAGPLNPKWVNNMSIWCVTSPFLFLFKTDTATSRRANPWSSVDRINCSSDNNGTSVGYKGVTVCPARSAQGYPSPVEPVWGTAFPPTAKTTDLLNNSSPFFNFTPRIFSSFINSLATGRSKRTSTCSFANWRINVSTTSCARFETGNMRPWSSSFNSTPRPSKKVIISSLLKTEKGLYKNRPFPGICLTISSWVSRLVTLHRPPPEMANFFPSFFPFSKSNTFLPISPAAMAAINPEGPPPIIITSYIYIHTFSFFFIINYLWFSCPKGKISCRLKI